MTAAAFAHRCWYCGHAVADEFECDECDIAVADLDPQEWVEHLGFPITALVFRVIARTLDRVDAAKRRIAGWLR